jgi:glyoxylase-like metal-dependent hydrolase (beta-lactamase superfamily II)
VQADRVYFRQLLAGRDFARSDPVAAQMANFVYALGDRRLGEAVLVDPAYAVDELVEAVEADGLRVVGALATHHHPDHVGGSLMGHRIEGVAALVARCGVPVHANVMEAELLARSAGVASGDVVGHDPGEVLRVGELEVALLHTPGHTPGSQCLLAEGMLLSGDTLFVDGCGRTDLPGSDPAAMYRSLRWLCSLPEEVAVFPGHRYSVPSGASLEAIKQRNAVLVPSTEEAWLSAFGPPSQR